MPPRIIPPIDRFMAKVMKTETCWIWTGVTAGTHAKYGTFRPGTRASDPKVYAHRFSYEYFVGPIPEGFTIDHVKARGCTSKLCVNPDHLEPVTMAENVRRARLLVCRSGQHDLTDPDNVVWDKQGRRRGCKPCQEARWRAKDQRRKKERANVSVQVQGQ